MTDMQDRIADAEADIRVIQKENELQTRAYMKFDTTLEKTQDLIESIHRLISIHDERINIHTKSIEGIQSEMDREMRDLEERLCKKLEDTEERILKKIAELKPAPEQKAEEETNTVVAFYKKIDFWKFFILGGIFAAGLILGKAGLVSNLFSIFYYLSGIV